MTLSSKQWEWARGVIDGLTVLSDNRWAMPSDQLTIVLKELVNVIDCSIPGAVVEMGCASCSTSMRLAAILQLFDEAYARPLHLYDSFQGFPEPTEEDKQEPGWLQRENNHITYPEGGPIALFRKCGDGLPIPIVHEGFFQEESDPNNPHPSPIALALIDCDMYSSLSTALRIVWPRVVVNGIVLIHDYSSSIWPGVRQATHEYFYHKDIYHQVGRWDSNNNILLVSKRNMRR